MYNANKLNLKALLKLKTIKRIQICKKKTKPHSIKNNK